MERGGLTLRVPGDKSVTQRALIAGALVDGVSRIRGVLRGSDPIATAGALAALGVDVRGLDGDGEEEVIVRGRGPDGWRQPGQPLDLMNSGTGARLLAGALAARPLSVVLTGDESLLMRPMTRITEPLRRMGATIRHLGRPGKLPMRIKGGPLVGIRHESRVASAQVKSAVLLAGLVGGVEVEVVEPARSRDHTERMLAAMGVPVRERQAGSGWSVVVPRASVPEPLDVDVPGDFSSAAFLISWAILAGVERPVTVRGVGLNPTRTGILAPLGRMGARLDVVRETGRAGGEPVGSVRVAGARDLRGVDLGADDIPGMIDEVPILAMVAARAAGVTRIRGAGELRVKESDRLAALAGNLRRIGVRAEEAADGLEIEGTGRPLSGVVHCFRDHRIAMAFGALGATSGCDLHIDDPDIADVSFPGYWRVLARARAWADRSLRRNG